MNLITYSDHKVKNMQRAVLFDFNDQDETVLKLKDFYSTYERNWDIKYQGVTKILSATIDPEKSAGLLKWRQDVGEEKANAILKESQDIGNSLDEILEYHFLPNFDENQYKDEIGYFLYKQLKPYVSHVKPVGTQLYMMSDNDLMHGNLDCLGYINGQLTLIDFKNSKKPKKLEYVQDYFLQATCYCIALYKMTGILVKNICIMIACRTGNNGKAQIFMEKTSKYVKEAKSRITLNKQILLDKEL